MKTKLLAIALMICTVCTCSKQSPLKAYRYTPPQPPPPQNTVWTWTKLNWGGLEAWSVVVDPRNGNNVYVASRHDMGGIWKSTDGGGSFAKIWDRGAWGIAIDQTNLDVLYASRVADGVWRSKDGGTTWNKTGNLYAEYVHPDRFDSSYILAGHFRSTDYGTSWSRVIPYIGDVAEVKAVVQSWQNPNALYATSSYLGTRVVYKSTNRGASWVAVDGGGAKRGYHDLAIDPWDDQRAYGVANSPRTEDSLVRTTNGGTSWETFLVGQDTLWAAEYVPIAVDPRPGLNMVLYAGGQGVHRSFDYGKTWQTIGLEGIYVRDIAVDPTASTNTTVLYIAAPCMGSPGYCDRVYRGAPSN